MVRYKIERMSEKVFYTLIFKRSNGKYLNDPSINTPHIDVAGQIPGWFFDPQHPAFIVKDDAAHT